jgi:cellulose synthase/poly-beta-1,6-N-acetylglucosamine synthase-like glycosyltransferase
MITKTYFLDSITTFSGHSMAFKASEVKNRIEYFFDKDVKVGVDYLLAKKFLEEGRKIMFARDASVTTYLPSSFRYFVLTELRWITAFIKIEGVSYRALACNIAVVAALILAISLSKTLFILSVLFNSIYMTKRARIFFVASRRYKTNIGNIFGFIILSYTYHVVGLISHIRHYLGLSKEAYLYQGDRY